MAHIIKTPGLSDLGINIHITTRQFGNMRIKDLTKWKLMKKMWRLRLLTGCIGKTISPIPALTGKIFSQDNSLFVHPLFYRNNGGNFDGALINSPTGFIGAIIGNASSYSAYLLANADCPIGVFIGKKAGKPKAICVHLALECLRQGITKNAYEIAKLEMDNIETFFFGYGIGPDMYKFSLKHPRYAEENAILLKWIKNMGVDVNVIEDKFPVDLYAITKAKLSYLGFGGSFIKEQDFPCTASAVDKNGEYVFFSNSRDRETNEAMYRNAVLVSITS